MSASKKWLDSKLNLIFLLSGWMYLAIIFCTISIGFPLIVIISSMIHYLFSQLKNCLFFMTLLTYWSSECFLIVSSALYSVAPTLTRSFNSILVPSNPFTESLVTISSTALFEGVQIKIRLLESKNMETMPLIVWVLPLPGGPWMRQTWDAGELMTL